MNIERTRTVLRNLLKRARKINDQVAVIRLEQRLQALDRYEFCTFENF